MSGQALSRLLYGVFHVKAPMPAERTNG